MPRPNSGPRLKWIPKRQIWYVVWYEAGRERLKSTGTADRGQAEEALAAVIGERQRRARGAGPRDPREVSVAEVLDLYGSEHAPTAADPARIGYAIDALLTFWDGKMVAQISKTTCRAYVKHRDRAAGTVRRELGTLTAALNFSVHEKLLERAPHVELPEKPEGKDRWLTREEAAKLLNAARTGRNDVRLYLPLFILLGLYTGARKQAILTLRWPQVDLERGRIDFRRGSRRTNKGRAHIPIPARLMTFLKLAHPRRVSDVGFVLHDKGRPIKDIGGGWDGKASADPKQLRGQGSFGTACKKAGLVGVTPHTLRHTRGTWMAQAGVDLWEIAGWLGQSYASTVELYAHSHPDFMEEAKRAADRR
jgi:integrase